VRRIETTVDIAASPERVWSVMSEVLLMPTWSASMTSVELDPPGPLAVGQRARIVQPKLSAVTWTVTEVTAVRGLATVQSASLVDRRDGSVQDVDCSAVFVMIGADPCTEAVTGMLAVDPAGYLLCGAGAASCAGHLQWPLADREPHLLETVRPGVFAAGDVRADASKRVAGAVGDGALVVRFAHQVLAG